MDTGRVPLDACCACIVSCGYYPSEFNLKKEAETLARNGCNVSVICLRGRDQPFRQQLGGVEVYRLPVRRREGEMGRFLFEYNAFFFLSSLQLLYLHLRRRFDIAQINTEPDYLVFSSLIPRLTGTKVILNLREPIAERLEARFRKWYGRFFVYLARLSERLSVRFADRVLVVSREMRDNLGKKGMDVNKISVVVSVPDDALFRGTPRTKPGIDIAAIKKEEKRKGVFRLLCLGTLEETYGLDVAVRAVSCLKQKLPGVQLRFSGSGDYLVHIMDLARALKVEDQVMNLGLISTEGITQELLATDAGVLPLKKNPYSVLVHRPEMYTFIAFGVPVITSRLDSISSYFPEDSIIYFEPDDEKDLADKIHYVFAHPEEMESRSNTSKEVCAAYGWEREEKKFIGVYHKLLAGEKGL